MTRIIAFAFALLISIAASAQQQQAGNAASTDTEGTFQALVDACDDVDALMLRARIRLQLPRTTEQAAAKAQDMLEQGFATCGKGDLDGAKATLSEALAVAEAGVSEKFEASQPAPSTQTVSAKTVEDQTELADGEKSPWWKFWK